MPDTLSPELRARLDREQAQRDAAARATFATFDIPAIARLRPGMPVASLAELLGSAWTPLKPKSEGYFFGFSAAGFSARIDLANRIGELGFSPKFASLSPGPCLIEGLSFGMSESEVLAIHPALIHYPGSEQYNYRELKGPATSHPASGLHLRVAIHAENGLMRLDLSLPNRRYFQGNERIPAPPGRYPKPSGKPGAPFQDPNLKLVILSQLLRTHQLDLGEPQDLIDHLLRRHVDLEQEGYELLRPVYNYLVRYPLTQQLLDSITHLTFDGGLAIYFYIWPFWDGESNQFDVRSLDGIELLPNLIDIDHIAMVTDEPTVEAHMRTLQRTLTGKQIAAYLREATAPATAATPPEATPQAASKPVPSAAVPPNISPSNISAPATSPSTPDPSVASATVPAIPATPHSNSTIPDPSNLSPRQLARFESRQRIAAYLRDVAAPQTAALSDNALFGFVRKCETNGTTLGLVSERAQGRWAYLNLITQGAIANDPTARTTITTSTEPPDAIVGQLLTALAQRLSALEKTQPTTPSAPPPTDQTP